MDLSGLPIGPFTVNDSYPEPYIVTSPCGVVAGGCGAPMVQATAGVPGCPAGRPLGLVADNSTAVVLSVAGDVVGMNITLTGGYHADSCQGGRAAVFNLLCDANAVGIVIRNTSSKTGYPHPPHPTPANPLPPIARSPSHH